MCLLDLSQVLSTTTSYEDWYSEVTPPIALTIPDMTGALPWPDVSLLRDMDGFEQMLRHNWLICRQTRAQTSCSDSERPATCRDPLAFHNAKRPTHLVSHEQRIDHIPTLGPLTWQFLQKPLPTTSHRKI